MPSIIDQISGTAPAVDAGDWRAVLLGAMGAPVTKENVAALGYWATSEGVDPKNNNWLAVTDPGNKWPHAGVVANNGGNPVYAFPSQAIGAQATAAFLRGSYYKDVVAAFQNNTGLAGIFHAINASPWCKGCQNNNYPIALSQAVHGGSGFGLGNVTGDVSGGSDGSAPAPGSSTAKEPNPCLIGGQTMPSIIPNVPCLLTTSQAHAIIGALVLVGGGLLLLTGVYMAAKGQTPIGGAAELVGKAMGGGTVPMRPKK